MSAKTFCRFFSKRGFVVSDHSVQWKSSFSDVMFSYGFSTLPAVWQVQSDAATDMFSETQVANGAQADVEDGDDAHTQIHHLGELLRLLHLIFQGKDLPEAQTRTEMSENQDVIVSLLVL